MISVVGWHQSNQAIHRVKSDHVVMSPATYAAIARWYAVLQPSLSSMFNINNQYKNQSDFSHEFNHHFNI